MLPNFFILGAPKCGTTSLSHWLSGHPDVFMCEPKEPRFFNTDFKLKYRPRKLAEYEKQFDAAKNAKAVGEASTGYLVSRVAVNAILDHIENPRFIVCLRSPVDMVFSLHAQRLKEGFETLKCVEDAWSVCGDRRRGERVPFLVSDAKLLDYDMFCSLGEQVDRLFSRVSPDTVHFVLLEQLEADPQCEFSRVCSFLGIEPPAVLEISHQNKRAVPRWLALSIFFRAAGRGRRAMGLKHGLGFARKFDTLNTQLSNSDVKKSFRRQLEAHFYDDIRLLIRLTGLSLEHWLGAPFDKTGREQ